MPTVKKKQSYFGNFLHEMQEILIARNAITSLKTLLTIPENLNHQEK